VKVIVFVAAVVKHQQFVIGKPDEVHHRRRAAIKQLSAFGCDKQVCEYSRHIMTSALHHN